ncbi:MAG TPA: RodZ domain-containing protein, partial [Bryobacteraceae bacterium]|nr:RodZ domain-containing protein [Bryobacteraceae bacterium]
ILATAGLLWWPRPSDSAGQPPVGGTPSSVIASTQPAPTAPRTPETGTPAPIPAQRVMAKPQSSPAPATETSKASDAAPSSTDTATVAMQVEIEAQEPAWVMVTDKDGRILIARTLQPNEVRTLEVGDNSILRTGNAGGLHVRLNGKDLGRIGPTGKIRDVLFKSGEFKVTTPDAG